MIILLILNLDNQKMGCCSSKTEARERIKIEGYHLERVSQIAEGAYGTIWQCFDPRSKQTYALK